MKTHLQEAILPPPVSVQFNFEFGRITPFHVALAGRKRRRQLPFATSENTNTPPDLLARFVVPEQTKSTPPVLPPVTETVSFPFFGGEFSRSIL